MRGKLIFAAGLAVGYVLGTKAGRERYEQIKAGATRLWNDPRVQGPVKQAEEFAKDKAPEVVEFLADGAKKVVISVQGATRKGAEEAKATTAKATTAAKKTASKSTGTTRRSTSTRSSGTASS
jgi:hypothetical protein